MHGEKGTGKGLKNVRVSQKNKGAQDAQNKKGREGGIQNKGGV